MAEELRPCPLCGSTDIACFVEECGDDYDNEPVYRAVVGCCGCHEEGCDPSYDEEKRRGTNEDCAVCRRATLVELADLIEPQTSEQTNPQESSLSASLCDRYALLALADEMDERRTWSCTAERSWSRSIASRIREALGVES